MTPFDYVMALVSIVIGLAMTTVLSCLTTLMHARERVVVYWPTLGWSIWLAKGPRGRRWLRVHLTTPAPALPA